MTGSVVKKGHAQHLATIQHGAWEPLLPHSSDCPKSKRERRASPYQVLVSPSNLQEKKMKHLSYIFFWSCEARPISFSPSKLQGSTGVEITSSRDAEGKGSFSWGSLLLSFQTGSTCRTQFFICRSPGKLLQHN